MRAAPAPSPVDAALDAAARDLAAPDHHQAREAAPQPSAPSVASPVVLPVALPITLPFAVALSGGADSTALLMACQARWPRQVRAWHIHHGLQAAADGFAAHCADLCARLDVPLTIERVDARAGPGESPEAVARARRYAAFDALARAQALSTVAIAQHADDQAETVLLALLRGAGVAGLAAMPERWRRDGVTFWRPLLTVPKAAIRDWLRARGQSWIEDPMNADERYARSRIRARLLPALQASFPAFRTTLARSSRHAAQARELLAELAEIDLAACGAPPRIADVQRLSTARQANLLRHWLATAYGQTPSSAQLHALLAQIAACTTRGHRIRLKAGQGFVTRAGALLQWLPAPARDTF